MSDSETASLLEGVIVVPFEWVAAGAGLFILAMLIYFAHRAS